MSVENWWKDTDRRKWKYVLGEKLVTEPVSTMNLTCTGLGSNPGLHGVLETQINLNYI